jgi:hypothetical protein|eukprot:COSAG01_NODE_1334_length_10681_cov_10.259025_5_plen_569_part_00
MALLLQLYSCVATGKAIMLLLLLGGHYRGVDAGGAPMVEAAAASVDAAHVTYRLKVRLTGDARSVYSLFGTPGNALELPPALQVKPPLGSSVGGVDPMFFRYKPAAAFDSWITVGITDGDSKGALSAIGLTKDFETWSENKGIRNSNCGVFWMNPSSTTATIDKGAAILAQLTVKKGTNAVARLGVQGKTRSGRVWRHDALEFVIGSVPHTTPVAHDGAGAQTFRKCANENQNCACTGMVRYGHHNHKNQGPKWSPWKTSTGGIRCTNGVFGDPAPGTVKYCECNAGGCGGAATHCAENDHPLRCANGALPVKTGKTYTATCWGAEYQCCGGAPSNLDTCDLARESPIVMAACCTMPAPPGGGGGHRRRRAQQALSCHLPRVCPSSSCAAAFHRFYTKCEQVLRATVPARIPSFEAFATQCQRIQGMPPPTPAPAPRPPPPPPRLLPPGFCPTGATPPVVGSTFCGAMAGSCSPGGGGGGGEINCKFWPHEMKLESECAGHCTTTTTCTGYEYYFSSGACYIYGPGMAQSATSPWVGYPALATTIGGTKSGAGVKCVAVAGRNSAAGR